MSTESSKVVWITVAVSAFVLVVAIAGVFLFYPRNQAPAAPATAGNTAAPKPLAPQDYLNAPATMPAETKRNNGDVIVIYGDKPQSVPPLGGPADGSQGTAAPGSPADQGVTTTTTTTTTLNAPASGDGSASPAPGDQSSTATAPTSSSKSLAPANSPAKVTAPVKTATKPVAAARTTPAAKVVAKRPAAADQFWIQAASFTERGKADVLRENLSAKGIAALIAVKDINGKSWYRVRIGPYSSAKEASGWLVKVKLIHGCDEAYVTTEAAPKT